ncbi:hypothetical protein ALC57_05830 [Trachymyrmex cornetzi]|uniref:Uncharacterized protein n=1 Tax=Trachymyrmex cornetzi TaxID=471704 RepID=A0A151J9V5_9HYME|nr:hypothetical protein ALC57_05830 [Trachymyrmex cornetzi]
MRKRCKRNSKLIKTLKSLLAKWKEYNYVDNSQYRQLSCSDGSLPRVYSLLKIHKLDCPYRIIVSSIEEVNRETETCYILIDYRILY